MKRVVALVVCALLLGAACSSREGDAPAATVNGHDISTNDLVDELNAILANGDYINSLQGGGAPGGFTVRGSTPGSFDAAFVAQVLVRQLDYRLIHDEVTKRKVPISDECTRRARDDAMLNLGQQNAQAGQALFDKFPTPYQDVLVRRNTEVLALEAALSGQICGKPIDAEGFYNSHPEEFTKLCISVIAVTDAAQADSIVTQARGGADFAALARQFSIDDQTKANGGSIGCRLPSDFNQTVGSQLVAAKTGDVLDPIPGQGGVSIVKVTDKQLAPLDEVRSDAEQLAQTSASQTFGTWLQQARASSQVTVDKRYGTWDPARFQINPPALDLGSSSPDSASTSPDNP